MTDIYNQLVLKRNREQDLRGDSLRLAYSTKKQIEKVISAIEDVNCVRSERMGLVTVAVGNTLRNLRSADIAHSWSWPIVIDGYNSAQRVRDEDERAEQMNDPGTCEGEYYTLVSSAKSSRHSFCDGSYGICNAP